MLSFRVLRSDGMKKQNKYFHCETISFLNASCEQNENKKKKDFLISSAKAP